MAVIVGDGAATVSVAVHQLADRERAEVVVVGSGAGGAPTAALLAEAGFDVLVLEEGPWVEQGTAVPFSLDQMERQYRAGGVTVALGAPSIAYTEGCCAGGGTEVNSGLYWRAPATLLERWRDQYRIDDFDPDELASIAEEVETAINVRTLPGAATAASQALARGAAALGWQHGESPRWMTYPDGEDPTRGRRQSMTRTYLPRAVAAGARVAVGCRVDRLVIAGDRVVRVDVVTPGGRRSRVRVRHVIVCCGAIHTPALLQRSGVRGNVGRSLAVHPTVKLAARFSDDVNVADDVPVHQVKEFAPALSFGGSASNPGLVALALSDSWPAFAAAIEDWPRISVYYAAITSEGRGTVRTVPRLHDPLVTYRLTARDRAMLGSGLARLATLMLAAGAEEVYPSFRGASVVRSAADVAAAHEAFAARRASVMTVHLCASAPMGSGPNAACDSFGRVPGLANVMVNDASLLPDAPGVNPQGTVMTVAIRNARRFVATERARG
jgi:choline dehydrogenase-like flavoprotein